MSKFASKAATYQLKILFTSIMLILLLITLPAYGASIKEPTTEYKIKAALIYKLTKFIEWPEQAFTEPDSPLIICVLGNNPFGNALNAIKQREVGNHPISIEHHPKSTEYINSSCHILFISATPDIPLQKTINSLIDHPILTISDIENFAEQGGIIQLANQDQRIGFKINLNAAKHSRLKIASQLLYLSTVVHTAKEGGN